MPQEHLLGGSGDGHDFADHAVLLVVFGEVHQVREQDATSAVQ